MTLPRTASSLLPIALLFSGLAGCLPDRDELGGQDSDGDGLTDSEEAELGTDSSNADSDGDGLSDFEEVEANTDPNDADDVPYAGGWAIDACRDDIESTGNGVGDIVEDFELPDQFGDSLRLHDFCGKLVVLVSAAFW